MKKYSLIAILIVVIMLIVGCSNNVSEQANADENETVSFSASNNTESNSRIVTEKGTDTTEKSSETTEKVSVSNTTTSKPAEQKSAGQNRQKSITTTQKSTTTQKQTTTKRVTTTKKTATTEFEWDCNVDGHTCDTGQIGWVSSFDVARDKALEYIGSHDASGNFRVEQCHMCGKYTAFITLD